MSYARNHSKGIPLFLRQKVSFPTSWVYKMPTTIEAPSPATTSNSGDAQNDSRNRSSNLSTGEAAVLLMANAGKKPSQQPTRQAPEETAPAAEAQAPNAETTPETPNAEAALAATSEPTQPAADGAVEAATTPETPEGEQEAAAAHEAPDAEAETVLSQTISFTPEQQQAFNKRLGKEVAKTKAIKAQMAEQATKLAALEAKLSAAPAAQEQQQQTSAPIVIPANTPLADVNDIAALGTRQQAAKEAIRYVEEVLDDPSKWKTITDPQNESREIEVHQIGDQLHTRTTLKAAMRNAKVTLEDHVPQRAQYLAARQQATQQAHIDFPFLTDKQSPEYQMVEAGRRSPALAGIMAMPNSEWLLGALALAASTLNAKKAAAAKAAATPAVKPKIPPAKPSPDQVAASASASANRGPIGSAERAAAAQESKKLSEKGGIGAEDAAKMLLKASQLRNSR